MMLLSRAMCRPARALVIVACFILPGITGCSQMSSREEKTPPVVSSDPELAKLLADLEETARKNPRDPVARGRLGMARHANGLHDWALEDYRQAMALDRSDPKWWYLSSLIETYVGRYEQGIADLDSAIARSPSTAHSHWRRGLLLLEQGDLEKADASFQRAIELKPNHPVAWIGKARVQLQKGDNESALQFLEESQRRRPKSFYIPYIHQLKGTAYRQMGKLEEAKVELAQGRGGRPAWSDPWSDDLNQYRVSVGSRLRTAASLIQRGENERAIRMIEELRPENPTNSTLLQYLSAAYLNSAKYEQAVEVLETALEVNPEDALAHTNLSRAKAKLGDLEEALRLADRGVQLNPSLANTRLQRASVLRSLGRDEEALKEYVEALRLMPTSADVLLTAANLSGDLGKWKDSESFATRVLAQDPRSHLALLRRAKSRTALGKYQEARDDLTRAAELHPNDAEIEAAQKDLARRAAGPPGGTQ
jgi:tetratricopeptide (TPR) repeat protein